MSQAAFVKLRIRRSSPPLLSGAFVLHSSSPAPSPPSCCWASPPCLSFSIPPPLKSFSLFVDLSFCAVVPSLNFPSSSFLSSRLGFRLKTSHLLPSFSSAVISPPVSAAVHYSSFSFSVCSSQCTSQPHMRSVFTHTCTLTHSPSLSLCLWLPPYACGLFCLPTPHLTRSPARSLSLSLWHTLPLRLSRCSTHCSASAGRITFAVIFTVYILTYQQHYECPPGLNTHMHTWTYKHTHTAHMAK